MNLHDRATEILNEYQQVTSNLNFTELERLADHIIATERVFLLAAGRSRCVLQMFAMRLAQTGLRVHLAGEVTTPAIRENELLLIASGSGETKSVLAMAEKAAAAGATIHSITATEHTRLTKLSQDILLLPTKQEQNTQVLGSFFETTLLLTSDLLIEIIITKLAQTPSDLATRHTNIE